MARQRKQLETTTASGTIAYLSAWPSLWESQREPLSNWKRHVIESHSIEPDGRMPHEFRRTCSFGYTLMNIRGFVDLAWISEQLSVDLWSGEEGDRLLQAVDFIYRQACTREEWPYTQVEAIDWRMLCPVLRQVRRLSGKDFPVASFAHRLPVGFAPDLFPMIEPIHPFGCTRSPEWAGQRPLE